MKKNRFVKIACAMLVMCLITTCAIGTTLAKYTTGSKASDTARVARWGVEVSLSGTLFSNAYTAAADGNTFALYNNDEATVLSVHESEKVVAPGTENRTGLAIRLNGNPEVDYKVEAVVAAGVKEVVLKQGQWGAMRKVANGSLNYTSDFTNVYTSTDGANFTKVDSYSEAQKDNYYELVDAVTVAEDYYPINWIVNGAASGERLSAILANIAGDTTVTYAAHTTLAQAFSIGWVWHYDVSADADKMDTMLGNLQSLSMGTLPAGTVLVYRADDVATYTNAVADHFELGVAYGIEITATQVD